MVMGDMQMSTDLLVIGGGPGGYGAARRGAELGLDVILVDQASQLGGLCLHAGCIPAKTLLHLSKLLDDTRRAGPMGLAFGKPEIDLATMRSWQRRMLTAKAKNLGDLCKQAGILVIKGRARFADSQTVRLEGAEVSGVRFKWAIIATGSRPRPLPGHFGPWGPRTMDPSAALALPDIPGRMVVVGGGSTGLEIGSIYAALGSRVTLMEKQERLLPRADPDLVAPLQSRIAEEFAALHLGTCVDGLDASATEVAIRYNDHGRTTEMVTERVVLAIGREPNCTDLGLDHTEVSLDDNGFIKIDDQQRTADTRIFAVGDVAGGPMLAHKAARQGRIAAEVISGRKTGFDVRAIPAVIYTEPQIAWCGLTEEAAKRQGIAHTVQRFPSEQGARDRTPCLKKLIIHPADGRILGVGLVGGHVEGFIGEAAFAIEMGALAEDLALVLHPYPTLDEIDDGATAIFPGDRNQGLPRNPK